MTEFRDTCWCKNLLYKNHMDMVDVLWSLLERVEKLEGYMEMEDRVTASDVLCRLNELERFQDVTRLQYKEVKKKRLYKCPACDAKGYIHGVENNIVYGHQCKSCDSKGIVWG